MGNYDTIMKQLASEMRKAHGDLTEVYFIGAGKYQSILHFSDDTYFPTKPVTDRDLNILKYAFQNYSYIPPQGQVDPLPLLTFGYSGTGAQCFTVFLSSFGFKMTNVANITSGKKLTNNGEILEFKKPPKTQISMKGNKGKYFPDDKDDKVDSTSTPQPGSSGVSKLEFSNPPKTQIRSGFLKTFFGKLFGGKTWKASNGEAVVFKQKYAKPSLFGTSNTYEEWTAPSAQAAKEFLNSRQITEQQYYLAVETPEGNWCKDRDGVYQD
jgi:hypothetical protein